MMSVLAASVSFLALVTFGSFQAPLRPVTAVLTDHEAAITSSQSTHSFSSKSLGPAFAGRQILVYAFSAVQNHGRTLNSVTVAGNAATNIIPTVEDANGSYSAYGSLWVISDEVNTTATITLSWSGQNGGMEIFVFSIADAQPISSPSTATSIDTPSTLSSISVDRGGLVLAVVSSSGDASATWTWTGLDEQYDAAQGVGSWVTSVAWRSYVSKQTVSPSASPSVSITVSVGLGVALLPLHR